MPKLKPEVLAKRNALKAELKAIKDAGLLPPGYGKIIMDIVNSRLKEGEKLVTENKVNQVAGGREYHPIIADVILELAAENKLEKQLKKAQDILS